MRLTMSSIRDFLVAAVAKHGIRDISCFMYSRSGIRY
jgi:hypothetical protein